MSLRITYAAALVVVFPVVALAQPYSRTVPGPYVQPQYGQVYASQRPDEAQCYAWCPQDTNPCDPANFKIADGRCRPAGIIRDR